MSRDKKSASGHVHLHSISFYLYLCEEIIFFLCGCVCVCVACVFCVHVAGSAVAPGCKDGETVSVREKALCVCLCAEG